MVFQNIYMNKKDIKLIVSILIISFLVLLIFKFYRNDSKYAYVYRNNKIIKKIDLTVDNIYEVEGKLGIVKIEVLNNKIRVIEENSNYHLCSRQGFIDDSYSSIVCLPNEIIIKLKSDIDTISR